MAGVLLIDDYDAFREAMAYCLPRFGHETYTARDAAEALRIAASARIEVVLVDAGAPFMTGLPVCTALRESVQLRDTPIILLTADYGALVQTEALRLGAAAVVRKPFAWPDLLGAIHDAVALKAGRHG
jgi:CheY-like chemotaxis protein